MLPASALAEDAAEPAETEEPSPVNEEESAEQEPESESTELLVSEDITEEEPAQLNASNATEVASGTCGDNLTWLLDSDGLLTISGDGKINVIDVNYVRRYIAKLIDTLPVQSI